MYPKMGVLKYLRSVFEHWITCSPAASSSVDSHTSSGTIRDIELEELRDVFPTTAAWVG